jgi:G3E family GTPase
MTVPAETKFFVLTGFLGSGKTTLLRDFLALPEAADSAVIVNEVGEIGLDGAILAESAGGVPMAQLSNGCVCCSLTNDLATTIDALIMDRADRALPPLRRIVLETSGLSKPGPILRSLAALAWHRLRVEVLCTFDCTRHAEIAGFEEAAAQWAGARTIVLTKQDVPGAMDSAAARDAIAGLNPLAEIVDPADRRMAVLAAFALEREPEGFPIAPHRGLLQCDAATAHPRISVLLAEQTAPVAWNDAGTWMDNLAGFCGERLLRIKGVLDIEGASRRVLVQSVGTTFSQPVPFSTRLGAPGFIVVIARDVTAADMRAVGPKLPFRIAEAADRKPASA